MTHNALFAILMGLICDAHFRGWLRQSAFSLLLVAVIYWYINFGVKI
jgi:hypothetical protein